LEVDVVNKKLMDEDIEYLFKAIASLENAEQCGDFLEDLCTVTEIKDMSQRLAVARMLKKRIIYTEIVEKTGASTATISRVNRSLNYGTGGYDAVLDKLED